MTKHIILSLLIIFCASAAITQKPFVSEPLTEKKDLSTLMVEGINRFLTLRTQQLKQERPGLWTFNFTSPREFELGTQANRSLLSTRLGIVDRRARPSMEILTNTHLKQLTIDDKEYSISAVRWQVLEELWAEGILVQPKQKISARIVMIPDADIVPETLAGFSNANGPGWGAALQMAKAGCQVLIPVMVNRQDTFSGSERLKRFTNQPHREWLYRQSYELGRHIIGYELQKVFAALDWFLSQNAATNVKPTIGVAGYGEGGMLALYAASIDRRIAVTLVSGYFNQREELWSEPIYRNIFGLLKTFGDAELATMAWPNKLIIEYSKGPFVTGPPDTTSGRSGAAPGRLQSPELATALAEWDKAKRLVPESKNHLSWIQGDSGVVDRPYSRKSLALFAKQLGLKTLPPNSSDLLKINTGHWVNTNERQKRTVRDIERNIQQTLLRCSRVRDQNFWQTLTGDIAQQAQSKTSHRKKLEEVIGSVFPLLPSTTPKARILNETDKWTSYELTLDVLPEIFAWGILMIPKNMRPGEKRPVVVCQHGLEGLPSDMVTTDSTAPNYHYYKGLATQLAERGYITFSPHNPYRGGDKFRVLQRKANPLGLTLFSIITAQHQRIVDWLSTQSFIDSNRIGFYGLSYGGKTAMRVPALINKYALSICSGDFNEWVLKNATTNFDFSYLFTKEYEMPEWDLGHTFNYAEMAALIAPRPFMVERGINDIVGTDDWINFEFAKVRHHYINIRLPHLCTIEHFPGPHTINGKGTFEFLDKHLKRNWDNK